MIPRLQQSFEIVVGREPDGLEPVGRELDADFNPELIAWWERHLPFATFATNPLEGPLDHGDETFDLVYAYPVFTHFHRSLQHRWIAELKRVLQLQPGGHLLFTTHGLARVHELPTPIREEFLRGGFVTQGTALRKVRNPSRPTIRKTS